MSNVGQDHTDEFEKGGTSIKSFDVLLSFPFSPVKGRGKSSAETLEYVVKTNVEESV